MRLDLPLLPRGSGLKAIRSPGANNLTTPRGPRLLTNDITQAIYVEYIGTGGTTGSFIRGEGDKPSILKVCDEIRGCSEGSEGSEGASSSTQWLSPQPVNHLYSNAQSRKLPLPDLAKPLSQLCRHQYLFHIYIHKYVKYS